MGRPAVSAPRFINSLRRRAANRLQPDTQLNSLGRICGVSTCCRRRIPGALAQVLPSACRWASLYIQLPLRGVRPMRH
ncbi:hypothetical protein AWT69_002850 [Pseudomonas putida]|nr:hypothetical protein AWT69_002850 [Pseudomonas putida]